MEPATIVRYPQAKGASLSPTEGESMPEQERRIHLEQETRIRQQIAFAAGVFQEDITIRTLLESLAEGIVIIDNSGTILLVNSRAEQMFGYPKKELIGMSHSVLVPERFRIVHEEHQAHYFAEPRIRPMGQLLDLFGRRGDGSEFPIEISLGFIETIQGVLVMALVSDITLRKEYEKRLREHEELFRIQVECVKDYAVFMLDAQGKVLNWNAGAERLKGYREEEIIGKHFSCFYPEEERNAGTPEEALKKAAAEGWFEDEGWRIRKDGSRFWAEVITTALRDENGILWGFSKVAHDITERKRAKEEIEQLNIELAAANRELEAFNYTVAHDLRKPLAVINGYCQILREVCCDKLNEECRDYIQKAFDGTWHMNRLIDALLNFSSMAQIEPRRETVDLSGVAQAVVAELAQFEPARQAEFRITEGISVIGDAALLRVVLDNLLGNAWKYTSQQEEAVIKFGVTTIGEETACFVSDNGPGFDMADAEKLFVPFQRAGKAEFAGHGIGLATVERIIRRHGGRVWAEGGPGKGATFFFTLRAGEIT